VTAVGSPRERTDTPIGLLAQAPGMDELSDPATLTDHDDVETSETTTTVGDAEFHHWDSLTGLVAVGVPTDDGRVLLMDGANGWALPNQPVAPREDWTGVARRTIDQLTGVDVEIDRPERVRRVTYRLEDGDRETSAYHVVLRAAPITGGDVADELVSQPTGSQLPAVRWFDEAPGADREVGDVDADVQLFVD